jgi:hypothetical protein
VYRHAVDRILAEDVFSGGGPAVTHWMFADQQGSVRDVAMLELEGQDFETEIVDHLVYDGFGNFTAGWH